MKTKRVHLVYKSSRGPYSWGMMIARAFEELGYNVITSNCFIMSKQDIERQLLNNPANFLLELGRGCMYVDIYSKLKIPTVLWMCSVITNTPHIDLMKKKGVLYDFVYTFSPVEISLYKECGIKVKYLPVATDPKLHKYTGLKKGVDVGFIGNISYPERREILDYLVQRYPVHSIEDYGNYVNFINQIKINLNIGWGFFGHQMRIFEVLACKGFLLTNNIPKQERIFKHKEHLVYYDKKSIYSYIDYYLKNEKEREEIAEQGYKEVLEKHTYKHRLEQMIKDVC